MILSFENNGKQYQFDTNKSLDISIPMIFNGRQPNTYQVPKATSKAYEDGTFVGDVRQGSGCNFETYTITPHCNGTHTECVGHISLERISITKTLRNSLATATLITIEPILAEKSNDQYNPQLANSDLIISKTIMETEIQKHHPEFLEALVIRTTPNSIEKKERDYSKHIVPFFSLEAMEYISSLNIKHLLVDLPSVDRTFDEGKLSAHHIFWGVDQGSNEVDINSHSMKTITEMIFVPDEIPDGSFVLDIQTAPFESDASPSRPILFKIT